MYRAFSLLFVFYWLLSPFPLTLKAQDAPNEPGSIHQLFLPMISSGEEEVEQNLVEEEDVGLLEIHLANNLLSTIAPSQQRIVSMRNAPQSLFDLHVTTPLSAQQSPIQPIDRRRLRVIVRLREPSVGDYLRLQATAGTATAQRLQAQRVAEQQSSLLQVALQLDQQTRLLGQVQKALNAIMLETDRATLSQLAANPDVLSIHSIINYTLALSETVPYVGARAVQQAGYDGSGVRVAVIDSGVDYTHVNLGGSGNTEDYTNNDPTRLEEGSFPTAKVVGGIDFVGSAWSGTAPNHIEQPDADPLDDGPNAGHGTHVADIIGGRFGVAPGVQIYAVKVCSSVAAVCSGVALLQAMDYVLDPNADGDISDAMQVVNLSLGTEYGSAFADDLSHAVETVSALGVVVVAAAGNSGDKPYVLGSPASTPAALAVAQTYVPSAIQSLLTVVAPAPLAGHYPAIFQPWSVKPSAPIEAPLQYGDGGGGNLNGCAPFTPGVLLGKMVLVNRGSCDLTLKISHISQAGGIAGIIGLIAPGDPFIGSDGGDRPLTIPAYMINQTEANNLKQHLAQSEVRIRFDPTTDIPLVKQMVGSSARGPAIDSNLAKPDIGAPGAAISAIAGSGSNAGPFSGTSGAAPIVTGAVALLRQAYPNRTIPELKAMLMNTAATDIFNTPSFLGGDLAAITRIGGGEVRVDRALQTKAAAWDVDAQTGSLSFGFQDVTAKQVKSVRWVNIRNYTDQAIVYQIHSAFRFANDAENGAIRVTTPGTIFVPAKGDAQFEVKVTIAGEKLRSWQMNSGARGADAGVLSLMEYDGYLHLVDQSDPDNRLHLAWHLLPRPAGDSSLLPRPNYIHMQNRGVGVTRVESYSLIGSSGDLPTGGPGDERPVPDFHYLGYATYRAPVGLCNLQTESFILAFAANTWERQTHANAPASYRLMLDTNQDGTDDYLVLTRDFTLNSRSDGRNLTWAVDLNTFQARAFFYTDHETNSANTVMSICAEQIGMTAADALRPIRMTAYIDDIAFGGVGDQITGMTIAPFGERYVGIFEQGGVGSTTLTAKAKDKLRVLDRGVLFRNNNTLANTDSGLLLLFRGGAPINREAGAVVILP